MDWIEEVKRVALDCDAVVTREWMEQAQQAAPYSVMPALLYLKRNGVKGNEDVLSRLAVIFPDRLALSLALGEDGKPDLEALQAINVELFRECLHSLLAGDPERPSPCPLGVPSGSPPPADGRAAPSAPSAVRSAAVPWHAAPNGSGPRSPRSKRNRSRGGNGNR